MDKLRKYKKVIIHCALIFMALLFVLRFAKEKYFDVAMSSYTAKEITVDGEDKALLEESEGVLRLEFEVTTDILWGLGLKFERHQKSPEGEIEIEIAEKSGELLYQATTPISDIQNNETYWLVFDEIVEASKGKVVTLQLQVRDIAEGDTLAIYNEVGQIYGQNAYLAKMFWAFALIVSLFVYGLYFMLAIKRCQIEIIFLVFMIFVGMMYAFLVRPGAIPDEAGHYRTAYAYSNIILGKSDEMRAEVWMDDVDYEFYQTTWDTEQTTSMYRDFQTNFLRPANRMEMVPAGKWPINSPIYLYTGQIIGTTLGRLLGFNGLTVFYLGRFFNVLVFAGLAFLAIKKLPFYKMGLFALCMFPMTTHLVGSVSYDGMILAISLILIAYIMSLAYGEQKEKRLKELIIIAIAGILLGGCKGGAYAPLLGLLFLIPTRYFGDRKRKAMFGGVVAVGALGMFASGAMHSVSSSVGGSIGWADAPAYNIGWVFENPMEFIQLISNTIAEKSGFLFESMIGEDLGWFNIPVSSVLILGFFGIFLLSCIYVLEKPAGPILVIRQKVGIGVWLLISVAMIAAGMMFSWTPMGLPTIEGMQGRYFLPLLLPLVHCLKNTNLTLKKSLDRKMIFALSWLHIMVFISVLGAAFIAST